MGFRGFMLATVCLLFALRTVPSMQERIIHENDGFKDLSAWTVKAGSWSTNWLSPEGSGLNLILLSKPVRGDWVMNLTLYSFYASPPLQIIVWWRDADNWLGFSAEKGQMKWVGMINGNQVSVQAGSVTLSTYTQVEITRRGSAFTAVVDVEHRHTYNHAAASGDGFVGFRCQGYGSARVRYFKLVALGQQAVSQPSTTLPEAPAERAPFVVDPNDLDKLAAQLWSECQKNPSVRQKATSGNTAVATFDLVDISSTSVAAHVAEDLYTAMIQKGFQLVERKKLNDVIRERKISTITAIDPKTAQEIGNLTGADLILVGSISDRGNFVVINARFLETATGKALVASRVEMRKIPIQR